MQWRRQNVKSSRNIKKMHPFLFLHRMGKENVVVHKKCLQGKKRWDFWLISRCCLVFDLYLGGLAGLQVVCGCFGWFGWFVDSWAGLWVVSSFTANAIQVTYVHISKWYENLEKKLFLPLVLKFHIDYLFQVWFFIKW